MKIIIPAFVACIALALLVYWRSNRGKFLGYVALIALILTPVFWLYLELTAGSLYMAHKCDNDAGEKIFKRVGNVDGFYDSQFVNSCPSCEDPKLMGSYKFIEFSVEAETDYGRVFGIRLSESGLYRAAVMPAGHPNCSEFYRGLPALIRKFEEEDLCVSIRRADKLKSEYVLRNIHSRKKDLFGDLWETNISIVEIESRDLLAQFVILAFTPNTMLGSLDFGGGGLGRRVCPLRGDRSLPLLEILRPNGA